jgi:hypothetical protein
MSTLPTTTPSRGRRYGTATSYSTIDDDDEPISFIDVKDGAGSESKEDRRVPSGPAHLLNPSFLASMSLIFSVGLAAVFLVSTGIGLFSSSSAVSSTPYGSSGSSSSSTSDDDILFSFSRVGYSALPYFGDEKNTVATYKFLESYDGVIEPHADMHLEVYSDDDASTNKFIYKVCASGDTDSCQEGIKYDSQPATAATINFECTPFDTFDITVTEYDSSGTELRSTSGSAVCMYVRREIRQLSKGDLDAFLDASYTMWSTSEEDGQDKYGENFHTNAYLVQFHHFNAAWQGKDMFLPVAVQFRCV